MDLVIRIADKDVDRVINQAADAWGYRLNVVDKDAESQQQYVLRYLKQLLLGSVLSVEKEESARLATIEAEEKFNREVVVDAVLDAEVVGGINEP